MSEESAEHDRDFMKDVQEKKKEHSDEYMDHVLWTPEERCVECQSDMERIECTNCDEGVYGTRLW